MSKTSKTASTALAVAQPGARKMTRPQQMEAASEMVLGALAKFAELLTGEHVTLPLLQAAYYHVDKVWKKPINELRDQVNSALKEHMRAENTSELTVDYGGQTFKAERSVRKFTMGKAKDMSDVKSLAAGLNADWRDLCREVISYEYDEAKAVELIKEKMPKADAKALIESHRVQQSESLGIEKV